MKNEAKEYGTNGSSVVGLVLLGLCKAKKIGQCHGAT